MIPCQRQHVWTKSSCQHEIKLSTRSAVANVCIGSMTVNTKSSSKHDSLYVDVSTFESGVRNWAVNKQSLTQQLPTFELWARNRAVNLYSLTQKLPMSVRLNREHKIELWRQNQAIPDSAVADFWIGSVKSSSQPLFSDSEVAESVRLNREHKIELWRWNQAVPDSAVADFWIGSMKWSNQHEIELLPWSPDSEVADVNTFEPGAQNWAVNTTQQLPMSSHLNEEHKIEHQIEQ